jgi:hypothetical protein
MTQTVSALSFFAANETVSQRMRQAPESVNWYLYEFARFLHPQEAKESGTPHATFQSCDFLRFARVFRKTLALR